jgi:Ni,Fe-hydrogenase I large subunit
VLELSTADQQPESAAPLLSSGALALGDGQAIAWTEMARGLLLHWVQLDPQGRVAAYQVVAPTEWNFHPQGTLGQALTQLAPQDSTSATLLGQAFDACVACQVRPANIVELCDA